MNIVTPLPNQLMFTNTNVNTEAARRDNVARETIPAAKDTDQGSSQQGLGSESDRARSPGQKPAPVTYERPLPQSADIVQAQPQEALTSEGQLPDNGSEQSAGKENAEQRQQEQAEKAEQEDVEKLKARDVEVRQHELSHAAVGGQHAGSPQYEYEQGPDGKRYVSGGEVNIDVSEAKTPEKTLQKMEQVRRAALAPAEPSSQDRSVAAEAAQKASTARQELATGESDASSSASNAADKAEPEINTAQLEINNALKSRMGVIQQFYHRASAAGAGGFTASA